MVALDVADVTLWCRWNFPTLETNKQMIFVFFAVDG